jgi:hypothetical protein
MHPFRAFLLSFSLGSLALFGGYGIIVATTAPPASHTIIV